MKQRNFRRLTMSAKAPAGRVKRKKGRDATVEIRDSKNVEEPSMFIVQVAAVSCAATQVPESKMADQSFRYTGFRSAAKVELLSGRTFFITIPNWSDWTLYSAKPEDIFLRKLRETQDR